jgi:competence protein ComEC
VRALALKVAHHGSRFSSTAPFLERARPRLAVISVGARNPFRHPSAEAPARLQAAGGARAAPITTARSSWKPTGASSA